MPIKEQEKPHQDPLFEWYIGDSDQSLELVPPDISENNTRKLCLNVRDLPASLGLLGTGLVGIYKTVRHESAFPEIWLVFAMSGVVLFASAFRFQEEADPSTQSS